MERDKESLSFGRYLQAIRLEKKISLEQVAKQTRIGLGNLMLVEQEDHAQLPAEVFVKGFLRSYAAAIGADGDEAVRRYESRRGVVQKIAESEASIGKPVQPVWWKPILALILLLCIIGASITFVSYFHRQRGTGEQPAQEPPAAVEQSIEAESAAAVGAAESEKPVPEKLTLQIEALEDTWVKVIVDEKESKEYSLKTGDTVQLEAKSGYNLLIGNAAGLTLKLNEKPVAIPGESGQVVTMHLP
ncbi:MAG: helix-turn-helix domain-containing protein [Desulfobacterales bacterium]|jgi:cytoskeleton protein RodZ